VVAVAISFLLPESEAVTDSSEKRRCTPPIAGSVREVARGVRGGARRPGALGEEPRVGRRDASIRLGVKSFRAAVDVKWKKKKSNVGRGCLLIALMSPVRPFRLESQGSR